MEQVIYLAGGCFWGVEKYFQQFPGVVKTRVGYANGQTDAPSYEEVCAGSGHAETVEVCFDPSVLSLESLLDKFFAVIDPFSVNKQGHDEGIQYRTGVYTTDASIREAVQAYFLQKEKELGRPLAVELGTLDQFSPAEEYHQKYLDKNPNGYCHIPTAMLHLVEKKEN